MMEPRIVACPVLLRFAVPITVRARALGGYRAVPDGTRGDNVQEGGADIG
jgi:hypothetical protein